MQHTVLILPHVCYEDLLSIVHYVYTGDVSMAPHRLDSFLLTARSLELSGLDCPPYEEESLPQDLSMKSHNKRPDSSPSPRPESQLRKCFSSKPGKSGEKQLQQNCKLPSWSQSQLQDAIEAVITQRLRFTQASARYGIPKGTLYDNILGKSKRMQVLDQVGLTDTQELSVLEFCCEISNMPYNRRTSRSLRDIIQFVTSLKHQEDKSEFSLSTRQGFKWWWAFTKKHNIISLYYQETNKGEDREPPRQLSSPDNLLSLLNNPSAIPINIPTFLGLNSQSKLKSLLSRRTEII